MKISKINAVLIWKQLEDVLVPRLCLTVNERVVYSHLLRHSRLEGKPRLRFSIVWLMRGARLSAAPARQAVRRLVAKGALRLVERTRAGHLVEVRLPDEIRAAPPAEIAISGLSRQQRRADIEQMDFLQHPERRNRGRGFSSRPLPRRAFDGQRTHWAAERARSACGGQAAARAA